MKTSIVRSSQIWAGSKINLLRKAVSKKLKTLVLSVISGFMLSVSVVSVHAEPELPHYSGQARLGSQTCGGSTCHGAAKPWANSAVLQNEFVTWSNDDPHSGAYEALSSDRGKRIAKNLGIEDAREEKVCLDCHTDNVPKELQSKNFNIADGVGCESCHGGAVEWLGLHVSGFGQRQDYLDAGIYPTEDPKARAKLCLSCHLSDPRKSITHRIMGAGHPRLAFELDTFTANQPAHYRIDADYKQRKQQSSGVKVWAVGQAMAAQITVEALMDDNRNSAGIFPELFYFDCYACHHSMEEPRWEKRESVNIGPGVPRLNDSNLVMLRVLATAVDPAMAATLLDQTRALHESSSQGQEATMRALGDLSGTVANLVDRFAASDFDAPAMWKIYDALVAEGLKGEFVDLITAEQATMALGSILAAIEASGASDDLQGYNDALAKAYTAIDKSEEYTSANYKAALKLLAAARK